VFRRLLGLLSPFHDIARELKILRELYEAELAERDPPIIRRTEKPRKSDTVVSYVGEEDRTKTALRKAFDSLVNSTEEDLDDNTE
jgi:hypothetical protein